MLGLGHPPRPRIPGGNRAAAVLRAGPAPREAGGQPRALEGSQRHALASRQPLTPRSLDPHSVSSSRAVSRESSLGSLRRVTASAPERPQLLCCPPPQHSTLTPGSTWGPEDPGVRILTTRSLRASAAWTPHQSHVSRGASPQDATHCRTLCSRGGEQVLLWGRRLRGPDRGGWAVGPPAAKETGFLCWLAGAQPSHLALLKGFLDSRAGTGSAERDRARACSLP